MTEFDGQQPDYAPEPAHDDGGQAGGLNINDGLAQARAAYQPGDEIPAPAYEGGYPEQRPYEGDGFEGDGYHGEQDGYQPEPTGEETVQQLFQEAAQEAVRPYLEQMEWDRRQSDVLALADQYPQLRDPETIEALEQELDALAEVYGDGARTDPRLIETAYLAHLARAEAQAGAAEQAREPSSQQGQHLETGVGPGASAGQDDPVEAAYLKALAGPQQVDQYGFPVER